MENTEIIEAGKTMGSEDLAQVMGGASELIKSASCITDAIVRCKEAGCNERIRIAEIEADSRNASERIEANLKTNLEIINGNYRILETDSAESYQLTSAIVGSEQISEASKLDAYRLFMDSTEKRLNKCNMEMKGE